MADKVEITEAQFIEFGKAFLKSINGVVVPNPTKTVTAHKKAAKKSVKKAKVVKTETAETSATADIPAHYIVDGILYLNGVKIMTKKKYAQAKAEAEALGDKIEPKLCQLSKEQLAALAAFQAADKKSK